MARRELNVTHYQADLVLVPGKDKNQEAVRITVYGEQFPERAVEPEILVGEVAARQVTIARDQKSIRGFFDRMPPEGETVLVRYGDSQEGALREPFSRAAVRPLPKEC
jgi:hypothetical protein